MDFDLAGPLLTLTKNVHVTLQQFSTVLTTCYITLQI